MSSADDDRTRAAGWPAVSSTEQWLQEILRLAEDEASELLDDSVDDTHLVLALSRQPAGSASVFVTVGLDARRLRDFVLFISGVNEAHRATRQGRSYHRTAKNRTQLDQPRRVTPEAAQIVDDALTEAAANNSPVGPEHLLVALCRHSGPPSFFGITASAVRQRTGLRPRPARYAHIAALGGRARRPRGFGPLVLGGGGDEVLTSVFARCPQPSPRFAFIGAGDPHQRDTTLIRTECQQAAGVFTDTGIYTRDDASDAGACDVISQADVIYLAGGRPEAIIHTLAGTSALDALINASDAGAIVMGTSAGAVVLGEATLSDRVTDNGYTRLETLNWIGGLHVHPHWVARADDDQETQALYRSLLPGLDTLVVAQRGAVWVEPRWHELRVLHPGDRELGAHLIRWPGDTPEPIPPL